MEVTPRPNRLIPISAADPSQTGFARRQAVAMASSMGFGELRQGQLGIIVTEAARNIAVHVGSGEIVLAPWLIGDQAAVDVYALDHGAGIHDLALSFQDGHSTAGTYGEGLGAMTRLSGELQVDTSAEQGTAFFARVYRETESADRTSASYPIGAICLPRSGETVCGDAWAARSGPARSVYIVADGLGHGPQASEAAQEAIRVFRENAAQTPARILADIHGALVKTRGAAVAIAEILHDQAVINYAGAGNIAGIVCSETKSRNMVSMNGTAGHAVARIHQFSYPWEPSSSLIMHSDGLGTRWSPDQYAATAFRRPGLLAGVLYRNFWRGRDDITVLVSRI